MIGKKIIKKNCLVKHLILCFTFSLFAVLASYGQVRNASDNLKRQAHKMGAAFLSNDYKTFAIYTYPLILKSMGGTTRMADVLKKTTNEMKEQGMSFNNITFDEPSTIVKSGKELQATIAQHTEIKLSLGRLVSTSTLIAISMNNGINWTFIDTSNKDIVTLKKMIPNLNPTINIPPQQPPVHYNL